MTYSILQLNDKKTFIRIDPEDASYLSQWTWRKNSTGYPYRKTTIKHRSKAYLLHRVVMKAKKGEQVDHINGDILDARKSNLRFTTQSENRMNARKQKGCVSQFKGVRRSQRGKPWYARIKSKPEDTQKEKFLGMFDNERHAALMYDFWAVELFGEHARTNFPVVAHS